MKDQHIAVRCALIGIVFVLSFPVAVFSQAPGPPSSQNKSLSKSQAGIWRA